jgi:SAM-dependent methyltransferase
VHRARCGARRRRPPQPRGFPQVDVLEGAFEDLRPSAAEPFDLVFAATAWHWLDPAVRYRRAWELLRSGGHLAFWSAAHVFPDGGDPFFAELQEVYEEIGEGLREGEGRPRPGELPDDRKEIEESGLFDEVLVRHFDWDVVYDAQAYLDLLDTFSGHIAMQPWQRDRLYAEIRRRLGLRPDGASVVAGAPSCMWPAGASLARWAQTGLARRPSRSTSRQTMGGPRSLSPGSSTSRRPTSCPARCGPGSPGARCGSTCAR